MNSSFDSSGLQFGWDSTSIKLASECLYKYKLRLLDGWSSPFKSVHLRFGGIYASALEHFHKDLALGVEREEAILNSIHLALTLSWDYAYTTPEASYESDPAHRVPDSGKPWDTGHSSKTRSSLIRTLVWYFETFTEDLPVVLLSTGRPAVEYSVKVPITDDLVFSAHFDKVVDFAGQYMIMDQKTTGTTVSDYFFNQFSPDTQMSMYTYLGRIAFNLPIKGIIIDAAQITPGFSRFERGFVFRTDSQLTEWLESSLSTIERARSATRRGFFPQNDTACGNYGGCEFRAVCSRSPEVREKFLASDFIKRPTWDPLKSR